MEKIKEMIDEGHLELATVQGDKHEQMEYTDLKQKVDFRNHASSISKSLQDLSPQQRKEWINERRALASKEFNSGNFDSAIKIYLDSLVGIDYSIPNIREEYQYPILLNMATCYYHQGEYKRGVALCESILREVGDHPMAHFKKGCLLIKLGEFDGARASFEQARVKGDDKLQSSIEIQLGLVRKYKGAESNIYKNMFAQEKEESTSDDQEPLDFLQFSTTQSPPPLPPRLSWFQYISSLLCPRRPSP